MPASAPTPWSFEASFAEDPATREIVATNNIAILSFDEQVIVATVWGKWLPSLELARRICACVNACEGIPTEELELEVRRDRPAREPA